MSPLRGFVGQIGFGCSAALFVLTLPAVAIAEEAPPQSEIPVAETPQIHAPESAPAWPRLGGHWGVVVPIVNRGDDGTTLIGRDFLQLGLAPGVTLKLDKHWAIDFEFIGFSRYQFAQGATPAQTSTSFVVDPGVLYNCGPFTVGLRSAVQIGGQTKANAGLVPILNKSFPIGKVAWFFELDFPFFVYVEPGRTTESFTPIVHTGLGF